MPINEWGIVCRCDREDRMTERKLTMVWSGCGFDYVVVLPRPHRKWGEFLCGGCGRTALKDLCAFWPWGSCVLWLWTSGENGGPWGTGWCCFGRGLVPPFRLGFRSIENIKWTLPALAATPLRHGQLKGRGHTTYTSLMSLGVVSPTCSRPHTQVRPYLLCTIFEHRRKVNSTRSRAQTISRLSISVFLVPQVSKSSFCHIYVEEHLYRRRRRLTVSYK